MASVVNQPAKYDAIIVGGGHNGLVGGLLPGRPGLEVCVLERYHEVGGAAITEETHPGLQALDRLVRALAGCRARSSTSSAPGTASS